MVSQTLDKLPVINFSMELEPGTSEWDSVKGQVKQAVEEYGCFEAIFTKIPQDLGEEIFGAMKELFDLPLQTKSLHTSNQPFCGYFGQHPVVPLFESFTVDDSNMSMSESVEGLIHLFWPEGNPSVSKFLHSFSMHVSELEQTVRRMILESMGVAKYLEEQMESTYYVFRVMKYKAPNATERRVGGGCHTDINLITILYQNQVEGLEVQTKDGDWISIKPSPDKFFVMTGDSFHAWTNGRVHSAEHRVMMSGNEARYSTGVFSYPKEDCVVKAPQELVDDEHPLLFKPFNFTHYSKFVYESKFGDKRVEFPLKAYCGASNVRV